MLLKELGQECKEFRKTIGKTQTDVSRDTGISREVVSDFENGRSQNLRIFLWYIDRGFGYGKN